jgi:hypothetical protein
MRKCNHKNKNIKRCVLGEERGKAPNCLEEELRALERVWPCGLAKQSTRQRKASSRHIVCLETLQELLG